MTTGDLKNNLRKLVSELKQIHYPQSELDIRGVAQGIPKAFLPIVHHVFLDYSISLAQYFASKEYELYGKTDLRFMEAVYKVLRDEFGYKPQLTREQFLTIGFAERKIIVLYEMVKLLREKHDELTTKGGKSEKKKAKQTWPSSQLRNDNGTTQDKVISTHTDRFPGPLPKDTDMKSFQSNEEAMKAGLGLKEPLVTRMFFDGDPSISTGSHEIPSNSGLSGKASSSVNDLVSSNLVTKSNGDQRLIGIKFPVSQNSEIRSNLSRQYHVKTVTWGDQLSEPQVRLSEQSEKGSVARRVCNGAMNPISVPAKIHSIPFAKMSPAYFPLQSENTSSAGVIPYATPSPISMTAAPMPSADLMLTPTVKNSHHQAIPLSVSRNASDLLSTSFSDHGKFPCTTVVRHSNLIGPLDSHVTDSSSSADAQVYVLKQQVQELQEKFDSMVVLNYEMSARVVLLESKMKLIEEATGNKSCCHCGSPLPKVDKKNDSQPDKIVVSGFNVQSEKNPEKEFFENSLKGISTKLNDETGNNCDKATKSMLKNNSTSRKLFKKTETSLGSEHAVTDSLCHVSLPYSEKSDDGDDDDDDHGSDGTSKSKSPSSSEHDASIVISPLPSVSKLSRVFANSSTKNTVVNVHKRLQETRELLVRTNRDFATKFKHYQVE